MLAINYFGKERTECSVRLPAKELDLSTATASLVYLATVSGICILMID